MGMKVDIGGTLADLNSIKSKAPSGARRALIRGGRTIMEESKKLTPVDSGDLERSHETSTEHEPGKIKITVGVGDKATENYALIVHENLTGQTFGDGEKSRAKAAALGVDVGPHFLTRAVDENIDEIADEIADEIDRAIG